MTLQVTKLNIPLTPYAQAYEFEGNLYNLSELNSELFLTRQQVRALLGMDKYEIEAAIHIFSTKGVDNLKLSNNYIPMCNAPTGNKHQDRARYYNIQLLLELVKYLNHLGEDRYALEEWLDLILCEYQEYLSEVESTPPTITEPTEIKPVRFVEALLWACSDVYEDDNNIIPKVVKYCVGCIYNTVYVVIHGKTQMELTINSNTHDKPVDISIYSINKLIVNNPKLYQITKQLYMDITKLGKIHYDQMLRMFTAYCSGVSSTERKDWSNHPPTMLLSLMNNRYIHLLKPYLYESVKVYTKYFSRQDELSKKEQILFNKAETVLVHTCINLEDLYYIELPSVNTSRERKYNLLETIVTMYKDEFARVCHVYGISGAQVNYMFDQTLNLYLLLGNTQISKEQYIKLIKEIADHLNITQPVCYWCVHDTIYMFGDIYVPEGAKLKIFHSGMFVLVTAKK